MKEYTLKYIEKIQKEDENVRYGRVKFDDATRQWKYQECLNDPTHLWYLSAILLENGTVEHYSLDYEASADCHYLFRITEKQVKKLFGETDGYLHEIIQKYLQTHTGNDVYSALMPYIFRTYCFY